MTGPRRWGRARAALPLTNLYVWLCLLYGILAWLHQAPWLFTDELEYLHLSRSVANEGTPAIRGEPQPFESLTTYLMAPIWWIWDMEVAYAVAKYVSVAVMTAVVFPAYLLARLVVGPRLSLFVAAASATVPALVYASILTEEPLAYTWSTLCLYLITCALVQRTRRWIAVAAAASLLAPLLRAQLGVLPAVLLLSGLAVAWTTERWRSARARWTTGDWIGGALVALGALILFSAVMGELSESWRTSVGFYKQRMFEQAFWAIGALAVGLGVLPLVGGLAALGRRPRLEPRPREHLAFAAVLGASVLAFGFYAAVKGAYISVTFEPRIVERNLFYLIPLLLTGLAIWLERPRAYRVTVLAASALTLLALGAVPEQSRISIYSDAPGLAIQNAAREYVSVGPAWFFAVTLLLVAASALLLALPRFGPGPRVLRVGAVVAVVFVLCWTSAAGVAASSASTKFARDFRGLTPDPPNWVDLATGGKPAFYLGQGVANPNLVWLLEFWNRSVTGVWSLDGSAPGPWAEVTPNFRGTDGILYPQPAADYVVADDGVNVVGEIVRRARTLTLYRIDRPLRLRDAVTGIYPDGWSGGRSAYTMYSSPSGRPGFLTVSASRENWKGPSTAEARVRVRIGPLGVGKDLQPRIGRRTQQLSRVLRAGSRERFVLRTPPPPFRVEVQVTPTFSPEDFGFTDQRDLGAQVRFSFTTL